MTAKPQTEPTLDDLRKRVEELASQDWCDVCNAPQMVMPNGEHRCAALEPPTNENVGRLELRHDGIYRCEDEVRDGLHWVLVLPKNHLETAIAKQPTPIAGEGELAQKLAEAGCRGAK